MQTISPNSTAGGNLASGDCRWWEVTGDEDFDDFVDQYDLYLPVRGGLGVLMSSRAFDAQLFLADAQGAPVGAGADGDSTDDVMGGILPAGAYTILATSDRGMPGPYTLQVSFSPAPAPGDCAARPIDLGAQVSASLSASDCRSLDLVPFNYDQSFAHLYAIDIPTRGELTIDQASADFDSFVELYTADFKLVTTGDDVDDTLNARVTVDLPAGRYHILADTWDVATGDYTLSTAFQPEPGRCGLDDLSLNGGKGGSLDPDDCKLAFVQAASFSSIPLDLYRIAVPQFGELTLEMDSGDFDAYLDVYDARFNPIISNDDRDESLNAGLTVSLGPGTYIVGAQALDLTYGAYALRTAFQPAGATCPVRELSQGGRFDGRLSPANCTIQDLLGIDDLSYAEVFQVTLPSRGRLTVTERSADFDAFLFLLGFNDRNLTDDDSGGGTDAALDLMLLPGTYTIVANSLDPAEGAYTLQTSFEPQVVPANCGIEDLGLATTRQQTLDRADCHSIDIDPATQIQTFADRFRVRLTQRGRLSALLQSSEFAPMLQVYGSAGELLDTAAGDSEAAASRVLPPGEFWLYAETASFNAVGAYRLETAFQPEPAPAQCPVEDLAVDDARSGVLDASDCRVFDVAPGSPAWAHVDRYRVRVPQIGILMIDLAAADVDDLDTMLELYDARMTRLAESDDISENNFNSHIDWSLGPGTYYIAAEAFDPDASGSYSVSTRFAPWRGSVGAGRIFLPLAARWLEWLEAP